MSVIDRVSDGESACGRRHLAAILRKTSVVFVVTILGLAAVGCGGDNADEDAAAALRARTGGGTGAGSAGGSSDLCGKYTALEIEQRLGTPVGEGRVAGPGGTACQWDATSDDSAYVQIQVISDTSFWEKPELAEGYKVVSGIGKEAFSVPELGGWKAGALTDTKVVYVSMVGGSSSEVTTTEFLRDALDRGV